MISVAEDSHTDIYWQPLKTAVRILPECILVTGLNEVVAKVIFLHLFVILFTGGGLP